MDVIEGKIKVDKTSSAYSWISGLDIQTNSGNFLSSHRDDDINGIMYATCIYLYREVNINPMVIQPMELLTYVYNYIPIFTAYLCQYFLLKRGIELTAENIQAINSRVSCESLNEKFWTYILAKFSGSQEKYILYSSIMNLCFGEDVEPEFVLRVVGDLIPYESNLKVIEELAPGMDVCGITLIERLSKKDHSEIWRGTGRGSNQFALKLEPLELEGKKLSKMLGGKDMTKMFEYIQTSDQEFINYNSILRAFPSKEEYFRVDYYNPLNMKVKILQYLEGPIGKVPVDDKKEFIMQMVNMLFSLHLTGISFGNLSMHHIMFNPVKGASKYKVIDYKHCKPFGQISTLDHGKYRSLYLLDPRGDSNRVNPYYDIESLLYIFNDLIMGQESNYLDLNDEIQRKLQLSTFSSIVADAINSVRKLMSCDPDMFFTSSQGIDEHVNKIYTKGFTDTNTGFQIPSIVSIIRTLTESYKEIHQSNIDITYANKAVLNNIRTAMAQDPRFQYLVQDVIRFEDITIKTLNVMISSVTYSVEDMGIINQFLLG